MKVGFVLASLKPEEGGGFTYEEEILHGMIEVAEQTHHTFAVFYESSKPLAHIERYAMHNIEVIRCAPPGMTPPPQPALFTQWQRFKGWIKPPPSSDIASESHTEQAPSGLYESVMGSGIEFMIGGAMPDIPFLFIVWDLQHRTLPWFPEVSRGTIWECRERIYSTILRRAFVVVVGTEAGAEEVKSFYQCPAERIKVLPHPTPDFSLRGQPWSDPTGASCREKFGRYLFYPAQFWAHKNHANLLLALKLLRDSFKLPFRLVLTGSDKGNLAHVKEQTRKLDLEPYVDFLGFVSREGLVALYRDAFALVYPSFGGPENLPPLEAFALNCPVVAADVPGAREQLGDAALLVQPGNPDSIAEAIRALDQDEELRITLIERGRKRAERWTRRNLLEGLVKILDEFEIIRRCW